MDLYCFLENMFSSVQPLSRVRFYVTSWTAAHQASLSITNSWSLLKLMSIKLVMPSNYLSLCWALPLQTSIFPSIRAFTNESAFHTRWPSIGVSASASVLSMSIQGGFPLGLTGLVSLQSRELPKSSPGPQFKLINSSTLCFLYSPTLTSVDDYWKNHNFD